MNQSECVPERIASTLEGCGVCTPCREQEAEKVEDMVSGGIIMEDEAEGLLERIWR
ncbi:hypothetical protein [Streptomyces nigrescens]|uniref:hypothetical protein n=1 Tax=Streptomyces nigrescens TaxID=1920 RepID=UPI0036C713DC